MAIDLIAMVEIDASADGTMLMALNDSSRCNRAQCVSGHLSNGVLFGFECYICFDNNQFLEFF